MPPILDIIGSYRQSFVSGAVTTIAAGTASAGHIFALRNATASRFVRIRTFEAEFLLTTAFGAAQEVGFDAFIARSYSAAHTGGTALTLTGTTGKKDSRYDNAFSILTGRIASTAALTAGTHTLDTNPFAQGSIYASAIGAQMQGRFYDFSYMEPGGLVIAQNEGIVVRNTVLMGATGVGKWTFSIDYDVCA